MAVRMTVHQAADLWRVNRRTVLKWIMGKDATGRGKRLVEGQDYEVIDTEFPGRKMYVLLREQYPVALTTAPIPRKPRGRRPDKPVIEMPSGEKFTTEFERRAAEEAVPAEETASEVTEELPAVNRFETITAPVEEEVVAEAIVETPKPRRPRAPRKPKAEAPPPIDSTGDVNYDDVEAPIAVEAPAEVEAPVTYTGMTIRQQLANWIPTLTPDQSVQEDPVPETARVIVQQLLADTGTYTVQGLAFIGQGPIEKALNRVFATSPLTREAQRYAGGLTLEYIIKYGGLKPQTMVETYPQGGYWPKTPQSLSGFGRFHESVSLSEMLPPHAWML